MKRSGPPKRKTPLRADPETTRAFVQRGRENAQERAQGREGMASMGLRRATPPSDFRDGEGRVLPAPPPKRKALKRAAKPPADPERIAWQKAWQRRTKRLPCAMCGSRVGVTGHHIIPLQVLKREGVPDWLWWDTRNHLALCMEPSPGRCHQRHELHVRRVPRDVVLDGAPRALVFANEIGLLHIFDREYPA